MKLTINVLYHIFSCISQPFKTLKSVQKFTLDGSKLATEAPVYYLSVLKGRCHNILKYFDDRQI